VVIGRDLLWESTVEWVGVDQAERRARLAMNKVGWQDCGASWQEANSHAAYVLGLCDLLEFSAEQLPPAHLQRLAKQIVNGCNYLALLQDRAAELGLPVGSVSHQIPKFEENAMPSDAAKAAVAWARAARLLPDAFEAERGTYRDRAAAALQWLRGMVPPQAEHFHRGVHGAGVDEELPAEWMTRDLLCLAWGAVELWRAGLEHFQDWAADWAEQVMARQVPKSCAEYGFHGHFRTFSASTCTEKAWVHQIDQGKIGSDAGGHFPAHPQVLLQMADCWPDHPSAPAWRRTVKEYAYGYLLPACRSNPFRILPQGLYPGEGLIQFAGLWHGMNAAYALTASFCLDLFQELNDPAFQEIATGNMQWIAGLNAGLTRESLFASHMYSCDVPEGIALPVSMICGIGRRCAGNWLQVRGAICNGFSCGDQFVFDVPPRRAVDGPHSFTDEDWISHAGAWLSALSRLVSLKQRVPSAITPYSEMI